MSSEPVYIKLFLDDLDALEELSYTERGRLLTSLLKYGRTGEAPRLTGNERILFPMFRARVDRDFALWREKSDNLHETRAEAGRRGGQARADKGKQGQANQANPSKPSKGRQGQANQAYNHNHDNDDDHNNDNTSTPLPPAGGMAAAVAADSVFSRLLSAYLAYCPETPEKKLEEYCRSLSPEVCFRAIDAARDAGRNDWIYLNGILRKREEWGVRSLEDWDRADAEWRRSHQTGFNGNPAAPAQNAETPEPSADERWGLRGSML